MANVRPKKALGQHFLTDLGVAARIASTLDAVPELPVLEIGPGTGVLTQFLLDAGRDLQVVEIDTESVAYLRDHFPALQGRITEGDFLRLPLDALFGGRPFALIGNYPYNISSQIFFHMLDYRGHVPFCSGMLQKEVAERLAARPGTKARGILSVLLQMWYDIDYLFTVPPGVFNPPPKVHSGVIAMRRNARTDAGCDEALFKTVVKATFGQRRKTIRNGLRGILPPGASMPESPLLGMRPEQLTVEQFITLTLEVERLRKQ